jgi:hypothetical protein
LLDFGKRQRTRPIKAITRRLRPGRALRHRSGHPDELTGTIVFVSRGVGAPAIASATAQAQPRPDLGEERETTGRCGRLILRVRQHEGSV